MTGLYRGEFVKLVQRAAAPYAVLKFYLTRFGTQDRISIVDFDLPRREGVTAPGDTENDWFQESFVCNVGVLENEWVPFEGRSVGSVKELCRGAKNTLEILLAKNAIIPTTEVKEFMRNPDLKLMEA